jgi:transcriptional regulator of acetoin/glycerol metabolism
VPDQLSAVTLAQLAAQPWPGNVRELFSAVEQAVLQLPAATARPTGSPLAPFFTTREQALEEFNRAYFSALVQRSSNLGQIARDAGLDRHYLQRILERHRIDWPPKR